MQNRQPHGDEMYSQPLFIMLPYPYADCFPSEYSVRDIVYTCSTFNIATSICSLPLCLIACTYIHMYIVCLFHVECRVPFLTRRTSKSGGNNPEQRFTYSRWCVCTIYICATIYIYTYLCYMYVYMCMHSAIWETYMRVQHKVGYLEPCFICNAIIVNAQSSVVLHVAAQFSVWTA